MTATKILTRKELYGLVWQQPITQLAKAFGLSDVGLAKICSRHNIPRPPRGYWAKKQFGKEPPKTQLPNSNEEKKIVMQEVSVTDLQSIQAMEALVKESQGRGPEKRKEPKIEVTDTLRGAHDLVTRTNQELQGARTNEYGQVLCPDNLPLDISTSKSLLRRSLLIMDALLKALEERGYKVETGPSVTILETTIRFSIQENLEIKREPAEDKNLDGRYEFRFNRFTNKFYLSGKLTLSIREGDAHWQSGCRHSWSDTGKQKLEDRLNQFVDGLIEIAVRNRHHKEEVKKQNELRRQEEARRAEAARLLAEKRKAQKTEKARVQELITQAENWHKAKLIREYIESVRQGESGFGPISQDMEIGKWIEWANLQADRFDPTVPNPLSILDEVIPEDPQPRHGIYQQW